MTPSEFSFKTRLLATLAKARWQVFIAVGLYIASVLAVDHVAPSGAEINSRDTMYALGSIGTVLALLGSASFAFTIFQITQANTRKHDLFHKFKEALLSLDSFLSAYDPTHPVVDAVQGFSWELKFIRISDFPVMDWEERLAAVDPLIRDEQGQYPQDPRLELKIKGHLVHIEELLSQLGITCIHQFTLSLYVRIVQKVFLVLGLLILAVVVSALGVSGPGAAFFHMAPVLFAVLTLLLLLEICWWLHRDAEEAAESTASGEETDEDVD